MWVGQGRQHQGVSGTVLPLGPTPTPFSQPPPDPGGLDGQEDAQQAEEAAQTVVLVVAGHARQTQQA